ncbi:O-antigen ligase family protein [Vallitalea guaymasensis]|uniref:O-antigen ligase family protein n=1 Tax=Vallitalea guaymasensis TaxID=1185412 RepID=UPI000DE1F0A3|nr:O-antigen ligase family protein [Vallitalea guaymasensis]
MGKKQINIILMGFVMICPFLQGAYFYHGAYLAGAILLMILMYYIIINRKLRLERSLSHLLILIGVLLYLISIFHAVDKGMAYMGFLKVLVVYLFYLVIMQTNMDKKAFTDALSFCGIIMSAISLSAFFIPCLGEELIQKGRLGSFFQYPNTFALFILVCTVLVVNREKLKAYHIIGIIIMWAALLLTFSRSMYIIAIGTLLIIIIYDRKKIKYLIPAVLLGTAVWYIIMTFGDFTHMFDRIEETSTQTSEWLTRLLYYKDSISIMKDYPFGSGHLGYFYIQRKYQTGATYYVKYIHSNVLQVVMDIGIVGFALMGIYFVYNTLSKRLTFYDKLSIFIIFGHGAIDFDWQFLVIGFLILIIVFVDEAKIKEISITGIKTLGTFIIASVLLINYIYMALNSYLAYIGDYEDSLRLYPYNTEAKINLASEYRDTDPIKAYKLADEIISQNPFSINGYIIKRDIDYENYELEKAYESAEKIVDLNPLSIKNLEKYSNILLDMVRDDIENDREREALNRLKLIFEIPYHLNKLAKERLTDYNVKHIPRLYMSEKLIDNNVEAEKLYDKIIQD